MAEHTDDEVSSYSGQRRLIALLLGLVVVLTAAALSVTWLWRVAVADRRADARLTLAQSPDIQRTQMLDHLRRGTLAVHALDVVAAERELSAAESSLSQIPALERARAATLAARARCDLALSRQRYAEAQLCLDRAQQVARGWAASGAVESRLQLAEVLRMRADAKAHARDWKSASVDYHEAESLLEQARHEGPDTAEMTLAAGEVQERLSRVEEVARNENGVTERLLKATSLIDRVVPKELSPQGLVQLIEVYQRLADLCSRWQRTDQARSFNIKAYDLAYALYRSSPPNTRYQLALAATEDARGQDALGEQRLLRATLFFAREADLLEVLLEKDPTNTQAFRDYFGARARLIETLVEQKQHTEGLEEFARLDAAVRAFVAAPAGVVSDEALAVGIRGLSLVADAARQLDRPKARVEASEQSLQLAKQRAAMSPSLGDAQLDLFTAHANMILAAGVTSDPEEMKAHAREARRLMPAEDTIEPDEQQLVTGIQKLIVQVIGPTATPQSGP